MRTSIVLAASLITLAAAAPSAAKIYTLTYTGTISGVHVEGAVNPASGFENGQSFTAKYTVNTANGSRYSMVGYDRMYGGPETGKGLSVAAVFTVNGVRQAIFNTAVNSEAVANPGELDISTSAVDIYDSTAATYYGISSSSWGLGGSANLDDVPRAATALLSSGRFTYTTYIYGTNRYESAVWGDLNVDSVVVAVPEPASWLMMIAGFGLVVVAVRRRRVVSAA